MNDRLRTALNLNGLQHVRLTGEDEALFCRCLNSAVVGNFKYLRIGVRAGRIRLSVPRGLKDKTVFEFVLQNLPKVRSWLAEQEKTLVERRDANPLSSDWRNGGRVGYLGHPLTIVCRPDATQARLDAERGELVLPLASDAPPEEIRRTGRTWLVQRFGELMKERVPFWCDRTNLHPTGVRASSALTRWGSCSQKGVIRLCWRLVCLPPEMFDYVVVHELTHLAHFDHSGAFWQDVRAAFPQTDEVRAKLKNIRIPDLG